MSDYTTWLQEAREIMNVTFMELGYEELIPSMSISFNNRFTARLGDASYLLRQIRLSAPLWPLAGEDERFQTVVHEVCHIVTNHENYQIKGYTSKPPAHGNAWKAVMRRAGVPVKRCHNVDRSSLKRKQAPRKQFAVSCSCGNVTEFGKTRYRRLVLGLRKYWCCNCQDEIKAV